MEINPKNNIVVDMKNRFSKDENDKTLKDLVYLLYDISLLTSGYQLEKPTVFANRI